MLTSGDLDTYYEGVRLLLTSEASELRSDLDEFYAILQVRLDIHKAARRRIAVYNATEFTPFDFFRLDENSLSCALACLLDADGSHGQGEIFLREFIAVSSIDLPPRYRPYKVKTEFPLRTMPNPRFLDILIDFGDLGIGIENKPWAGDQPDQIGDYCTALDHRYGGEFRLVYLAGDGREPASISGTRANELKGQGKLITLSYAVLTEWLARCSRHCEADKVRWFLRDLAAFLAGEFGGRSESDEIG